MIINCIHKKNHVISKCAVFILCFCFRYFLKEDGGGSFGQFIWVLILKSTEKPSAQIFPFFFSFCLYF